jgi:glycosyltransferase involved in cell wall biosynthesis
MGIRGEVDRSGEKDLDDMKVHILFDFVDGPWGGGNQFLQGLRNSFNQDGIYATNPKEADVILFNSHHRLDEVLEYKYRSPEKLFIHRVDGPVFMVRGRDKHIDRNIFLVNELVADGTVFQSDWSRMRCVDQGMKPPKYQAVIFNAPDSGIFHPRERPPLGGRKIRLVATSWSSNEKKGFDIYRHLDASLDFERFEMTFIGNTPCRFRNIRCVAPLESARLAEELRQQDIYITGSLDDPCSNSLIEALHCGLPAVARDSGGHPEIVGDGGALFKDATDVIDAIVRVANNYDAYVDKIATVDIEEVSGQYVDFIGVVTHAVRSGGNCRNPVSAASFIKAKCCMKSRIIARTLQVFGRAC